MQKPFFRRFHDLTSEDLNVDYQMHTNYTDGECSIAEILERCSERKLRSVAFTEHVRRSTEWFDSFADDVAKIAEQYQDLEVFAGCEAKALDYDGALDVSQEIFSRAQVVLGSVHRFPGPDGKEMAFDDVPRDRFAELECDLSVGLLRNAPIDVLAHPAGMYQRRIGEYPIHLFRRIVEASMERDIAVEISWSYLKNVDAFLKLCDELNPRVSIGSDVHKLSHIGQCRDMLIGRRVGAA
jgi:putative hydrolase